MRGCRPRARGQRSRRTVRRERPERHLDRPRHPVRAVSGPGRPRRMEGSNRGRLQGGRRAGTTAPPLAPPPPPPPAPLPIRTPPRRRRGPERCAAQPPPPPSLQGPALQGTTLFLPAPRLPMPSRVQRRQTTAAVSRARPSHAAAVEGGSGGGRVRSSQRQWGGGHVRGCHMQRAVERGLRHTRGRDMSAEGGREGGAASWVQPNPLSTCGGVNGSPVEQVALFGKPGPAPCPPHQSWNR